MEYWNVIPEWLQRLTNTTFLQVDTHMHAHTRTHTDTQTNRHTQIHIYTQTDRQTDTDTHTQRQTSTHTLTHTHTHTRLLALSSHHYLSGSRGPPAKKEEAKSKGQIGGLHTLQWTARPLHPSSIINKCSHCKEPHCAQQILSYSSGHTFGSGLHQAADEQVVV